MSGPFEETMARAQARLKTLEAAAEALARLGADESERRDVTSRRRVLDGLIAGFEGGSESASPQNGRQPD